MIHHHARLIVLLLTWSYVSSFQLLVYGLGNVGRAVTNEVPNSWIVHGTTRTPQDNGMAIPFSDAPHYLLDATHVLITIPLGGIPEVASTILQDLSDHLASSSSPTWIGFVSTTGVYGNHDGEWVTEESPLHGAASSSSTQEYSRFEQDLIHLTTSASSASSASTPTPPSHQTSIFRCAGLYGPDQSALHTLWRQGSVHVQGGVSSSVTNRIHEHDVARAIVSAMKKGCSGIYNLSDDEPAPRSVVMDYAAELLTRNGLILPEREVVVPEMAMAAVASSSKRTTRRMKDRKLVDNSKMKAQLIDELLYPTYREGLNAIFADKRNPWWK
jgi:nucleoside-diphosphate-sugar epimerase